MMYYGVDVSKDTLDIACDGKQIRITNDKKAIKAFIKTMPVESSIAMESTNIYHLAIADMCYASGMSVYVLNPRITHHYREVLNMRGNTDKLDAKTIYSYIKNHHADSRLYVPKSADQRKLQGLVRRRAKLSAVRVQLSQTLSGVTGLKLDTDGLLKRIDTILAKIDILIDRQLENNEDRDRLLSIKGVGPVVSAVLLADLEAGQFESADAFVAFYGLDPVPKDSGKSIGERKISKKGHRLGRKMLYVSALSAASSKAWKPVYEYILSKKLKKVQALVVLARKIARTAWSIYTHKTKFLPERILIGLT